MTAKKFFLVVVVLVAGFFFLRNSELLLEGGETTGISGQNKAILKIEGMSCGSCVDKITKALTFPGKISKVSVSLARASAAVMFDPSKITPQEIATAASVKGEYKTTLLRVSNEKDLKEEEKRREILSADYSFAVDSEKIKNADFEKRVDEAMKPVAERYGIKQFGKTERMQIISQVADEMILEILIDREIAKKEISTSDKEIENEIKRIAERYKLTPKELESSITSQGESPSSFREKVVRSVKLNKYLDMEVFPKGVPEKKKGFLFNNWIGELKDKAQIEIYNEELIEAENYLETSGGCGGSCCS